MAKKINEDWGSSDWSALINTMQKDIDRARASGTQFIEAVEQAAEFAAEFYGDQIGYERPEDTRQAIINMYIRRMQHNKKAAGSEGKAPGAAISESIEIDASLMERDHLLQMTRQKLYFLAKDAMHLHSLMKDFDDHDTLDWIETKVELASEYIADLIHHCEQGKITPIEMAPPMAVPSLQMEPMIGESKKRKSNSTDDEEIAAKAEDKATEKIKEARWPDTDGKRFDVDAEDKRISDMKKSGKKSPQPAPKTDTTKKVKEMAVATVATPFKNWNAAAKKSK